jgi:riboflavin synthase
MFTGIIEEIGTIAAMEAGDDSVRLRIECLDTLKGVADGDSIAVDGTCLTVTSFDDSSFSTFASAETLRCTSLGDKKVGDHVNLEGAMTLAKKMSGHMVQGHVDGVGHVKAIVPEGESQMWHFTMPAQMTKFVGCDFTVAIIPKTIEATTFQFRKAGDSVNLEVDIIGKYVHRFLHPDEGESVISINPVLPA